MPANDMPIDRQDILVTAAKFTIGMGSSGLALVTAWQEQVAWLMGILIAGLTAVSIALDIRRKLRAKREEKEKEPAE